MLRGKHFQDRIHIPVTALGACFLLVAFPEMAFAEDTQKSGVTTATAEVAGAVSAVVMLMGSAYATYRKWTSPNTARHDQIKRNLELLALMPRDTFATEADALSEQVKDQVNELVAPPPHRDLLGAAICWVWVAGCLAISVFLVVKFQYVWWAWALGACLTWWAIVSLVVGYDIWTGKSRYGNKPPKGFDQSST